MTSGRSSLWLLLCAMLMRALVPSGFMLDETIGAGPALIACDGKGAMFGASPTMHHGDHHDGQRGTPGNGDCPLSSSGAIDTPPPILFTATVERTLVQPRRVAEAQAYRPSAAAAPPPSTGPPLIA